MPYSMPRTCQTLPGMPIIPVWDSWGGTFLPGFPPPGPQDPAPPMVPQAPMDFPGLHVPGPAHPSPTPFVHPVCWDSPLWTPTRHTSSPLGQCRTAPPHTAPTPPPHAPCCNLVDLPTLSHLPRRRQVRSGQPAAGTRTLGRHGGNAVALRRCGVQQDGTTTLAGWHGA